MLYFAYGSNLNHFQMKSRCKGSKYLKNYYLRDYELCFCWNGTDRSDGVANIVKNSGSYVPGAIWEISKGDKHELDKYYSFKKKTPTERLEDIEILRFFDLNKKIKMVKTTPGNLAVDEEKDIKKVEKLLKKK